jgi:hypothetical protein
MALRNADERSHRGDWVSKGHDKTIVRRKSNITYTGRVEHSTRQLFGKGLSVVRQIQSPLPIYFVYW